MILPYPDDPASFDQPNPLFNDNAFVRGDQFRLNNSKAWDNFLALNDFLALFFSGYVKGRMLVLAASPTIIRIPVNNAYDVNGLYLFANTQKTLDFSNIANTFRTDGVTPIAAVSETQNKHLYLQLNENGILQAMLIPSSDIIDNNYGTNPLLFDSYYTGTPAVWDSDKNGYYRNNKRIIATLRLNGSNQIQFFYELGIGQRFQDVLGIGIGNLYREARWKRCHPNCYLLDGSTVSDMSTVAPLLYQIYGSNTLPNYNDYFERNIDLSGGRSIRDLQADAFQGHHMLLPNGVPNNSTGSTVVAGGAFIGTSTITETGNPTTDGTNGTPRTADETRSKNFAISIQVVRG